jgi:thiamine-phosphate pyrophosphorylase
VAIGGVQRENVGDVAGSGVAGIAVVSAICSAPSPAEAARELAWAMREGTR